MHAYKKIVKFKNIEGIDSNTSLDISVLKHKRVRELFTIFEDYSIDSIPYCGNPDYEKLLSFILTHKVWYDTRNSYKENLAFANKRIEKLRNDFSVSIVVFDDAIVE